MKRDLATAGLLALLLAQASTNLGIPQVPGTRVPESNPATAVQAPASPAPGLGAPSAGTSAPTPASGSGNTGPAYSFGAAPPPVVTPAPGR